MQSEAEFSYNERYGVRPANRWITPAIILGAAGVSWLIWAGLHHSNPNIRSSVISYTASTDREITLSYSVVRKDKEQVLICTIIGRDYEKNIVGQIDDKIPLGTSSETRIVRIPTRLAAVNAQIETCSTL